MDKKERIERFEHLRLGLFMHFGLYSAAGEGEWAWHNLPGVRKIYGSLKEHFDPEKLDFTDILSKAREAGMRYAVLTARHHDGFSLYDTRGLSDYDVMHTPYGRDIVRLFADACRECGMMPFFYHTMHDWQHPLMQSDFDAYLDYHRKSVELLCTRYGEVGGFWFDGCWSSKTADWKLDELYSMIRRYQPDAMIINNTGLEARGVVSHPDIDAVTYEQGHTEERAAAAGEKLPAAEACVTLAHHWGYAKRDIDFRSPRSVISELASCRGKGINYLLNVGPRGDGSLRPFDAGMLEALSVWTDQVRDIFYDAERSDIDAGGRNFALEQGGRTYLFVFGFCGPESEHSASLTGSGRISLRGVGRSVKSVRWRDNGRELRFSQDGDCVTVDASGFEYGRNLIVRVAEITYAV